MSLKDLMKAQVAKKSGRGLLLPYLNGFLNTLDDDTRARRYPQWMRDLRERPSRHDYRFHPSSLGAEFCGREWVIQQYRLAEPDSERSVDVSTRRIFELGDMIHCMIQYWFAEAGMLYGRWMCSKNPKHDEWGVSPVFCKTCGAPLIYKEVPIDHAPTNVLGHCDGEVWLPDGRRIGIEAKSAHPRIYESVGRHPLEDHRVQAAQYLSIRRKKSGRMKHLGEPKLPDGREKLDAICILYYNKENSQMREHVIQMDESLRLEVLEPIETQMAQARAFVPDDLSTLPPRTCKNHAEGRGRKCEYVDACFGKLPPVQIKKNTKGKR